jgi:hypothetical protein
MCVAFSEYLQASFSFQRGERESESESEREKVSADEGIQWSSAWKTLGNLSTEPDSREAAGGFLRGFSVFT